MDTGFDGGADDGFAYGHVDAGAGGLKRDLQSAHYNSFFTIKRLESPIFGPSVDF
jgi:hypothetical protein